MTRRTPTRRTPIRRTPPIVLILVLIAITAAGWWALTPTAAAAPLPQDTPPATPAAPGATPTANRMPNLSISNQYCLDCHGQPIEPYALENGDALDMYVDPAWHQNSVHGQEGYACVQCHTDVGEYPHPAWQAADRRDATLKLNNVCSTCHEHQFALAEDDVHASAQRSGIREAAVCVDCHTAHEVRRLTDPKTHKLLPETRQWIPERCALCHNAIYQKYKDSVHGAALLQENNSDVPTCIDCHGVHNISNPTTAFFRLRSPDICAKCHTDERIMGKYGINTNVLNTYVADFHGSTVAIFEKTAPNAPVNKAVCYDCHGIHDIARPDDPQKGLQIKENLLARCQNCHPDATTDFPDAWLSHYTPSPDKYPVVYYVNLFYKFFIPGVLVPMAVLVLADVSRGAINRRRRRAAAYPGPAEVFDAPPADAADLAAADTDAASPNAWPQTEALSTQPGDPNDNHPSPTPDDDASSSEASQ